MPYAVKEMFDTLQGEGARSGARSVFLRLAGCNLWNGLPEDRDKGKGACARWCDTDFVGGDKMTALEILARLNTLWPVTPDTGPGDRWVVISGGEPMLQLDETLVNVLHEANWAIALETNGTVARPQAEFVDWVTMSPKLGTEIQLNHVDEVKVVLPGDLYGGWSEGELRELHGAVEAQHWFVQPQDPIEGNAVGVTHLHGKRDLEGEYRRNVAKCLSFIRNNPGWRLSLQTHKYIQLP